MNGLRIIQKAFQIKHFEVFCDEQLEKVCSCLLSSGFVFLLLHLENGALVLET